MLVVTAAVGTSTMPVRFRDLPAAVFVRHPPVEPNGYVSWCPGVVAVGGAALGAVARDRTERWPSR